MLRGASFFLLLSLAWGGTLSSGAQAKALRRYTQIQDRLPVTIKIVRPSPVFEDPSARAKILADADIDTVLIAREISPKGGWLLVEDEDGNKGWVPVKRTNLVKILRAASAKPPTSKATPGIETPPPPPENFQSPSEEVDDSEIEEARNRNRPVLPTNTAVIAPSLYAGSRAFGANLAVLFPSTSGDTLETSEHALFGAELGVSRVWNLRKGGDDYTIPLRLRMLRRSLMSSWATGPDLALLFRVWDHSFGTGIGYGVYYVQRSDRGIFAGLRGGVELGGRTHYLVEWSLGWMF